MQNLLNSIFIFQFCKNRSNLILFWIPILAVTNNHLRCSFTPLNEIKNASNAQTVDKEKQEELEKYVKELLYERTAGKKEDE